jgi:hypothetical protein
MNKQIIECDFSTDSIRGFTWFNDYQGKATISLVDSGALEFSGEKHKVYVYNIGTANEKVTVVDL